VAESTAIAEDVGIFTRDQVEILATRKGDPEWLRAQRLRAHDVFGETPTPTIRAEEWRYTDIGRLLKLDRFAFADDVAPVSGLAELPSALAAAIASVEAESSGSLVYLDGSLAMQETPELPAGVIFGSLEQAAREHPELVQRYLGTAVTPEEGKFAALNGAFWTGGLFLYVPKGVRVPHPLRSRRWLSRSDSSVFPRTLIVAEDGAEVTLVDELASPDFASQTLSVGAAEVFADDGAGVNYVAVQRWGKGVMHLSTDRLIAGRDARITTLSVALGGELTRADIRCSLEKPGSHVDMLGLYIAEGTQHFDHQTLQDHRSPHASSNLLFKGALTDQGRSVFRGLIRVHPKAQRTDAYQTNRNLILSDQARADSLPNLEIQADDVRCSHAATVGQLDEEELFYLLSRGIHRTEAVRLVIFGFFGEVLDQLPPALDEVKRELVRAVEAKLAPRQP
jgi:Fe-S cluster assembly protein SufD